MAALEKEFPAARPAASADAIPLALRRRGGTSRHVVAITLIGTLVLALFASSDLSSWLGRMGDGPLLVPLQHAAAGWDRAMRRIGFATPAAVLRNGIHRLLDAEWPESSNR